MRPEVPPWLPGLPQRWGLARGRTMAQLVQRQPSAEEGVVTAFRDGQVTLRSNRRLEGFTEALQETGYQSVRTGELVIHSMDGFAGAVGVSESDGKMSPVVHIYSVPDDNPYYVAYALRVAALSGFIQSLAKGIRERSTSFDKATFKDMLLPHPCRKEQDAIVAYLDRETARIDTLIAEQQRLIELLRERRADLISHAVLDATSQRTQLRRLVDVIDCAHVTAEFVADDYRFPVASIRECQGATVDLSACNYTTAEFFEHLRAGDRAPRAGDLLFIRNVSVGLASVVAPDLPEFAMGQETVLLRRKSDVHPAFLRYALVGAEARHAIEGAMIGSTFRRINVSAIRSLQVPTPFIDEQRRIAAYLDEQTAKIDALVAESERFIELARERRSALITAAVTGQIDVRGVA